jgi:hypothetical protein
MENKLLNSTKLIMQKAQENQTIAVLNSIQTVMEKPKKKTHVQRASNRKRITKSKSSEVYIESQAEESTITTQLPLYKVIINFFMHPFIMYCLCYLVNTVIGLYYILSYSTNEKITDDRIGAILGLLMLNVIISLVELGLNIIFIAIMTLIKNIIIDAWHSAKNGYYY